jgi:hypothetical protein
MPQVMVALQNSSIFQVLQVTQVDPAMAEAVQQCSAKSTAYIVSSVMLTASAEIKGILGWCRRFCLEVIYKTMCQTALNSWENLGLSHSDLLQVRLELEA